MSQAKLDLQLSRRVSRGLEDWYTFIEYDNAPGEGYWKLYDGECTDIRFADALWSS